VDGRDLARHEIQPGQSRVQIHVMHLLDVIAQLSQARGVSIGWRATDGLFQRRQHGNNGRGIQAFGAAASASDLSPPQQ